MSLVDIKIPDIGDFHDVEVIEILVKAGDTVAADDSILTLESDKASMEIPSPEAGVIKEIIVKLGDRVNQGDLVMKMEVSGAAAAPAPEVAAAPAPAESAPAAVPSAPAPAPAAPAAPTPANAAPVAAAPAAPVPAYNGVPGDLRKLPHASPSIRAFARELGVDLSLVKGTGEKERILMDDVRNYVKGALKQLASGAPAAGASLGGGLDLLPWPKVDFSKFGETEVQPLKRIKKISGANMARNWVMIPHVTNNEEADITELEALRKQLNKEYERKGVKFTMLAFLIRAAVQALKEHPTFNSSLDGDNLILKKYYNIGFAADTPNGLVVPVLKDADKKSVSEIAKEVSELAALARDGKLSPAQMQGGCFTISSLGGIGGTHFTPIINAPEVAILGVSRSAFKPVWNGKEFEPRLILPMSLSYDHRVIDGAAAARFNVTLSRMLSDFRRVLV